ncbi:hypothetical protein JCM31447_25560 [Fluviispira sanaruensis]|uniref:ABC transporter domain-containing protein n=2 Tax=Fluviispira sanaruensis TaxID=2493639 RepID=A0A4P2VQ61_FLUSA|nr:hypothetical protein JCM31447_25560 [Fluviispira sanaruensis]
MRTQLKEQKDLVESAINYSSFSIRTNFLNNLAVTLSPFLGIILLIIIICMSQIFWQTPGLVLLSFLYLLIRFIQNLSSLVGLFGILNIYYPQFKATMKYFHDYPQNEKEEALKFSNNIKFYGESSRYNLIRTSNNNQLTPKLNKEKVETKQQSIPPSILFNEVSFCYSPSQKNVIQNLNFFVKPGSQIGIIGPSGAGKSTILMLLLNILIPQKGEIKIDQAPVQDFFKNSDNMIGYVGPEPFLIKGTLRENVIYGIQRDVIDEEILESCEKANLKELVLEKGFDYEISEDHAGLSAGQKQRLCLARALLNNPKLLVLDEATANLDDASESSIAESIHNFKGICTVVIVSHRPGILKGVDNIIKLV